MPDQMHDVVSRLGQLEGTVQTFMKQWEMQDTTATSGRRVIHDRLELVSNQIARVATDVQNTQQDVAEMRKDIDDKVMPQIEAYRIDKERKIGAKGVWALIWTGIAAVMSLAVYAINAIMSHLSGKP